MTYVTCVTCVSVLAAAWSLSHTAGEFYHHLLNNHVFASHVNIEEGIARLLRFLISFHFLYLFELVWCLDKKRFCFFTHLKWISFFFHFGPSTYKQV